MRRKTKTCPKGSWEWRIRSETAETLAVCVIGASRHAAAALRAGAVKEAASGHRGRIRSTGLRARRREPGAAARASRTGTNETRGAIARHARFAPRQALTAPTRPQGEVRAARARGGVEVLAVHPEREALEAAPPGANAPRARAAAPQPRRARATRVERSSPSRRASTSRRSRGSRGASISGAHRRPSRADPPLRRGRRPRAGGSSPLEDAAACSCIAFPSGRWGASGRGSAATACQTRICVTLKTPCRLLRRRSSLHKAEACRLAAASRPPSNRRRPARFMSIRREAGLSFKSVAEAANECRAADWRPAVAVAAGEVAAVLQIGQHRSRRPAPLPLPSAVVEKRRRRNEKPACFKSVNEKPACFKSVAEKPASFKSVDSEAGLLQIGQREASQAAPSRRTSARRVRRDDQARLLRLGRRAPRCLRAQPERRRAPRVSVNPQSRRHAGSLSTQTPFARARARAPLFEPVRAAAAARSSSLKRASTSSRTRRSSCSEGGNCGGGGGAEGAAGSFAASEARSGSLTAREQSAGASRDRRDLGGALASRRRARRALDAERRRPDARARDASSAAPIASSAAFARGYASSRARLRAARACS